jgi:hypothetical protein
MIRRFGPRLRRHLASAALGARVKSYGDVLREYEFHPEAKCADSSGVLCTKQTVGLLGRRRVAIDSITYIGKESNRLEEVEESLLDSRGVYTEHPDPRGNEWATSCCPNCTRFPFLKHAKEQALAGRECGATVTKARGRRWSTSKRKTLLHPTYWKERQGMKYLMESMRRRFHSGAIHVRTR